MNIDLTEAEKAFMEGYFIKGDKTITVQEWYSSIADEQGEVIANMALFLLIDSHRDIMGKVYENRAD